MEAAKTAKDNAAQAAMDAEQARDEAMAAYMRAMSARTDSKMAKAEYEKAKTAATEARTAADAAEAAYMVAKMAAEGIMDDGTVDDAKMGADDGRTDRARPKRGWYGCMAEDGCGDGRKSHDGASTPVLGSQFREQGRCDGRRDT